MQTSDLKVKLNPLFRVHHVGSLLRPPEIVKAHKQLAAGEITKEDLKKIEDEQITRLVAKQVEVGIKDVTDGDLRRYSFFHDFFKSLGGIVQEGERKAPAFKNGIQGEDTIKSLHIIGRITHDKDVQVEDFKFLQKLVLPPCTPKVCIPSLSFASFVVTPNKEIYADDESFFKDLIVAYRAEIDSLYKAGCRHLQLDDATFTFLCDPRHREIAAARGQSVERYAELVNAVLEGRPSDLIVSMHSCKGNYKSQYFATGGYEYVAKVLFNDVKVDIHFVEWEDERSGDFKPLRHVPKNKLIVLGLVSTKFGKLEKKEDIIARLHEAAQYCPLEQLAISPQCGFASTEEGNELSEEDQWNKLKLCVEIAKEVWGDN